MDRVKIKELATLVRGVSYKKNQASKVLKPDHIAVLRANNISNGTFNSDDLVYVPRNLVHNEQVIHAGDIVITMSSGSKAHVGKVALAINDMGVAYGAFCSKLVVNDVLPKYLFYILRDGKFRSHIESKSKGTNINNIKQEYILDYEILLPNKGEQQRIVNRIEEMFSQLDAGVETLKKTKAQLAVYRQAVLKEAFERVTPMSISCNVEDVCKDIKVGIVIKPAQYYTSADVGIRAFRSLNVREFSVNDSDWVFLTQAGHEANLRSEIHTGDVLVVRSGYPGTACVVPPSYDGCNAIDILIAVPDTDKITPEYLCAYTNSPLGRKIVQEKKRGVAQAHFNVSGYSKTPIIVPCLDTQKAVVSEIESRLSVCSSIEQTVDTALLQADAMRQSILKDAFEGRL